MPLTRFRYTLIAAGLLLTLPARAMTWHVDPQGNDTKGNGSAERPWRSIQKALDECAPGDAVLLHAGIYPQRVEWPESGLPGKPITLMGEEGAVLSGKGMPAGEHVIAVSGQSHVRITGLEIRDTVTPEGGCGIYVDGAGDGIEIRNCWLHHLKGKEAGGIGIFGTVADKALTNVVIEGCRIEHCEPARSEALVLNGNVDGFRVVDNIVRDVNNIGIDFIGGEKDVMADVTKVARNGVCLGNQVTRARSSYEDGYAAGIYVDGGRNIVISGNTITECDLGIEVGAENPGQVTQGITVEDNAIHNNDKAGLVLGGYDKKRGRVKGCVFRRNQLRHNTNHREAHAELWIQEAGENTVEGNWITVLPGGKMALISPGGTGNVLKRNMWWSSSPAETVPWTWGRTEGAGFGGWQATSKEEQSVWREPQRK